MHTRCGTTEKTAEKETSSPNDLQTTEERKWNMFYGEKKEQIQKKNCQRPSILENKSTKILQVFSE